MYKVRKFKSSITNDVNHFFLLLMTVSTISAQPVTFKAERIHRTATISLKASIEKVFPLFGPIREKEWADGWEPTLIFPQDAVMEEHMIFQTKGRNEWEPTYRWVLTQLQSEQHLVEYTVSTDHRIWFIRVQCKALEEKTTATITYSFTGLTPQGNQFNHEALTKMFAKDLKDWEEAINFYLSTGKRMNNH